MNNPNTFTLGWGLFAGCFLTGASIGYFRAVEGRKTRALENIQQTKDRNESLDRLEAKWRAEGKLKPKKIVVETKEKKKKEEEQEKEKS